jgi:hypothetical protein
MEFVPCACGSVFQISFKDYYKKQYDINIQDLEQPLLLNRIKSKISGQGVCMNPDVWMHASVVFGT